MADKKDDKIIEQQWTQYIPSNNNECVRCGYCCKKATCHIGLSHGAESTNCKFLVGKKPGEYSCWLADKEVYPHIKVDLGIGSGCCEPFMNTERMNILISRCKTGLMQIH